jgi:hypothetical protein
MGVPPSREISAAALLMAMTRREVPYAAGTSKPCASSSAGTMTKLQLTPSGQCERAAKASPEPANRCCLGQWEEQLLALLPILCRRAGAGDAPSQPARGDRE